MEREIDSKSSELSGPGRRRRSPEGEAGWRRHWPLAVILALAFIVNQLWHATHATPVSTGHRTLLAALDQVEGLLAAPLDYLMKIGFYAAKQPAFSLFNIFAAAPLSLFGITLDAILRTSLVFYLVIIACVYGTVASNGRWRGASAAAAVAAMTPGIFNWSTVYSPIIAVEAATATGLLLMARSERLTRPILSALLLIVVFSSLFIGETVGQNVQTSLVVGAGLFYFSAHALITRKKGWQKTLAWVAVFAILAIIASRSEIMKDRWHYITGENNNASAGRDDRSSWQHFLLWMSYPNAMWHVHLRPFFASLTVAAIAALILVRPRGAALFLSILLFSFLVLTFTAKKDADYLFWSLPLCAVMIGMAVDQLKRPKTAGAALIAIMLIGGMDLYQVSFQPTPDAFQPRQKNYWKAHARFQGGAHSALDFPVIRQSKIRCLVDSMARFADRKGPKSAMLLADIRHEDADAWRFLFRAAAIEHRLIFIDPYESGRSLSGFEEADWIIAQKSPDITFSFKGYTHAACDYFSVTFFHVMEFEFYSKEPSHIRWCPDGL